MRKVVSSFLLLPLVIVCSQVARPARSAETSYLYTVAEQYEPLAWMHGAERFASGATIFIHEESGNRALAAGFAASADAAVSFDATRVLFAGKKSVQDRWQIWESNLDGTSLRQVTKCVADCVRPFYLAGDRIVYAGSVGGKFVIQAADLDGGNVLSLTYGPESSFPTDVLRDGRVLFESTYRSGDKQVPEIYTVYSDGSGVESYRCDHGSARHAGRQVGSGDVVFAESGRLARFTSALAKEVPLGAPTGDYAGDVVENNTGEWLMAWRAVPSTWYQLMWWKPGEKVLRAELQEQGSNVVEPVFVAQRVFPKRHPSGLHDWQVGNLLCLNAYTSKYEFAAASIHSVRIHTRDEQSGARVLGTVPVEADGSFFVQVPGDQPLQIELLDSTGKTLKREQGWFWMRRGEQRACVGCHAGPDIAPENAVPQILLKSTTPADMTGKPTSAGGH